MDFIFKEADILIKLIGFEELISSHEIASIDKSKEIAVKLKNMELKNLPLNSIKSDFFDFYSIIEYFADDEDSDVAVKNYRID